MKGPQRFVKRPVEIWAVQYVPHENCQQIREFLRACRAPWPTLEGQP